MDGYVRKLYFIAKYNLPNLLEKHRPLTNSLTNSKIEEIKLIDCFNSKAFYEGVNFNTRNLNNTTDNNNAEKLTNNQSTETQETKVYFFNDFFLI